MNYFEEQIAGLWFRVIGNNDPKSPRIRAKSDEVMDCKKEMHVQETKRNLSKGYIQKDNEELEKLKKIL